jgi:hypothetical protein
MWVSQDKASPCIKVITKQLEVDTEVAVTAAANFNSNSYAASLGSAADATKVEHTSTFKVKTKASLPSGFTKADLPSVCEKVTKALRDKQIDAQGGIGDADTVADAGTATIAPRSYCSIQQGTTGGRRLQAGSLVLVATILTTSQAVATQLENALKTPSFVNSVNTQMVASGFGATVFNPPTTSVKVKAQLSVSPTSSVNQQLIQQAATASTATAGGTAVEITNYEVKTASPSNENNGDGTFDFFVEDPSGTVKTTPAPPGPAPLPAPPPPVVCACPAPAAPAEATDYTGGAVACIILFCVLFIANVVLAVYMYTKRNAAPAPAGGGEAQQLAHARMDQVVPNPDNYQS